MERRTGTTSRGIRCPIIREGDDLAEIVTRSVLEAADCEGFEIRDRDVVAITESVVARAQGNYCTVSDIAEDTASKFGRGTIGVIFPILSRNRFAVCLRGIAEGADKVVLQFSYPSDEVGNELVPIEMLDEAGIDPYRDVLTLERFRELFGDIRHPFTGMDYIGYYQDTVKEAGAECEVILANDPRAVLEYTKKVINCDIHTRKRTKRRLLNAGAEMVCSLDELMNSSVNGSGYNEQYGLLGSNKADENRVKLFPRDASALVYDIQKRINAATGKSIEVMIYGDGAFKDPVGKIWELADPVVSPACTPGLIGTPNELKIKYLADNDFSQLDGDALRDAVKQSIQGKDADLKGNMASQGTTPRRLTDLIGSLCDLTSGSGDKGTPVVFIQGYFDNYSQE